MTLAAATQLSRHGVSAGPVVALLAIVAVAVIAVVMVSSFALHHRAASDRRSPMGLGTADRKPSYGTKTPLSTESGTDHFSR